jgi:hypothetical protein
MLFPALLHVALGAAVVVPCSFLIPVGFVYDKDGNLPTQQTIGMWVFEKILPKVDET